MEKKIIPFNLPYFAGQPIKSISRSLASGFTAGNGPLGIQAEELLSELHNESSVLLTTSCSSALELAARLIGFRPGDEVIVPSFTFVTTVSSFVANGATPVFCDINPDTYGLDPVEAEALITSRTRAICVVHYAGIPANPIEFEKIAARYGLILIEDNAHGLGVTVEGRKLGTFGSLSTLSFHETKNLSCGEGGALVINDSALVAQAEILREKGTDRTKFMRGQVDKYTWVDLGASWVISDILSAILVEQLQNFSKIQQLREDVWTFYWSQIHVWAKLNQVAIPPQENRAFHMFFLVMKSSEERDRLLASLRQERVYGAFHYQPLHASAFGARWVREGQDFSNTNRIAEGLLRLPLYPKLR